MNFIPIELKEVAENDGFSVFNPDLIDFKITEDSDDSVIPLATSYVQNILLPNGQCYELCSQLNAVLKHMFRFTIQYSYE